MKQKSLILFLMIVFTVRMQMNLNEQINLFQKEMTDVNNAEYRDSFFSNEMRNEKENLSQECLRIVQCVENDASYYPVPESTVDKSLYTAFENSWMNERTYGGERGHEGCDIMASENIKGKYPVVSMTKGTVTNIGWLEKGGYRIGITSDSGIYYYYAHLDSYANVKKGQKVAAGQLLGYMGDSGYGKKGTTGKFPVHLHVGIYVYINDEEISLNPYYLLRYLENRKLKYAYS